MSTELNQVVSYVYVVGSDIPGRAVELFAQPNSAIAAYREMASALKYVKYRTSLKKTREALSTTGVFCEIIETGYGHVITYVKKQEVFHED